MRFTNINSPCRHLPGAIYAIYSARPPNSPQGKLSKVANSNQALTTLSWRVQLLGSSFRFRKRNSLFRLRVVQKVEAVTWFGCRHSLQCLRMSIHPRLSDTKCPLNIPGYGSPVRHLGWWTSRPAVAWNPGYENETTSSRCPNVLSVHVKPPLYNPPAGQDTPTLQSPCWGVQSPIQLSLCQGAAADSSRNCWCGLENQTQNSTFLQTSPHVCPLQIPVPSISIFTSLQDLTKRSPSPSNKWLLQRISKCPFHICHIYIYVPQKKDQKRFLSLWGHRAAVRCSPIFGRPRRRNSTPWKAWRTREQRGNNVGWKNVVVKWCEMR